MDTINTSFFVKMHRTNWHGNSAWCPRCVNYNYIVYTTQRTLNSVFTHCAHMGRYYAITLRYPSHTLCAPTLLNFQLILTQINTVENTYTSGDEGWYNANKHMEYAVEILPNYTRVTGACF